LTETYILTSFRSQGNDNDDSFSSSARSGGLGSSTDDSYGSSGRTGGISSSGDNDSYGSSGRAGGLGSSNDDTYGSGTNDRTTGGGFQSATGPGTTSGKSTLFEYTAVMFLTESVLTGMYLT
jgi:hypothetical protein